MFIVFTFIFNIYQLSSRLVLTHHSDPQLSTSEVIKKAKAKFRASNKLGCIGSAKTAMTSSQRSAQEKYINKALYNHGIATAYNLPLEPTQSDLDTLFNSSNTPLSIPSDDHMDISMSSSSSSFLLSSSSKRSSSILRLSSPPSSILIIST
jgi:hypothetical protein